MVMGPRFSKGLFRVLNLAAWQGRTASVAQYSTTDPLLRRMAALPSNGASAARTHSKAI